MLIRILFQNVLSFLDGTEFNLLPNPRKKRLAHHVYQNVDTPVVKTTAIYGANGAGKSNVLKGMDILRQLATDPDYLSKKDVYGTSRFLLKETGELPMSFGVEFSFNHISFFYHIEILNDIILTEQLYMVSPEGEDVPIYICRVSNGKRYLQVYDDDGNEMKDYVDRKTEVFLELNPSSSLMSLLKRYPIVYQFDYAGLANIWFSTGIKIVFLSDASSTIEALEKRPELFEFSNEIMGSLFPEIKSIEVRKRDLMKLGAKEWTNLRGGVSNDKMMDLVTALNSPVREPNRPEYITVMEEGNHYIKDLRFMHEGPDNQIVSMSSQSQSEGTRQLLAKLPVLYEAFEKDVTVFIDEIENGTHPILIHRLLQLFLNDRDTKGQLVFTTHAVQLLNQKTIRADEVWFAEKEFGCSKLYSLNDFKEHQTIDIAKGYLAGRYGAIPFFEDNNLLNISND